MVTPVSGRPLIVGLGEVGLDVIGVVGRMPESDIPHELGEVSLQIAGAAAIAVATAAAMGTGARLACKLADDFIASHVLSALGSAGIDTRCHLARDARLSGFAVSLLTNQPGRRRSYFTRGDVSPLAASEVDATSLLDGASALLIDGSCPSAQRSVAELASRRGIPVIFDGSQVTEGLGALASLADVLICSERLAADVAPRNDLRQTLAEIQRLGPRAVVITMGDAGSVGLIGDELVEQPSFPVEVLDRSGAGAVYHGAFSAALVGGLPFGQCLRFASAAAALACRKLGGFAGIPTREDTVAVVRSQG
jgi:sugar/nucleoside kinase (ribokinase family)